MKRRDFLQDRWNQRMPDYAHDMVTVAVNTPPQEVRQFSQIPAALPALAFWLAIMKWIPSRDPKGHVEAT